MSNNGLKRIIVIVGPTSSGKSDLAIRIAQRYNGEVISADSRQVYRGLDVGSGKVPGKWQMANGKSVFVYKGVRHHFIDFANPKRQYSVAQFQKEGGKVIRKLFAIGYLPIICGGTGFYIRALIDGIIFPDVKPNRTLRLKLERQSLNQLVSTLQRIDPVRARSIDACNKRRVMRALEIADSLGSVPAVQMNPLPYPVFFIGIAPNAKVLKKRIHARIALWLRSGLRAEIRKLLRSGLSEKRIRSFGLVYSWALDFENGTISRSVFIEGLARDIFAYARRQYTWFKKDKRIHWITKPENGLRLAEQFLKRFP